MKYFERVLIAMDRVLAAVLGWSGRNTVSYECGRSSCVFCRVLCALLNKLKPNHCVEAAEDK